MSWRHSVALLVVSAIIGLVEAFVGYKRRRNVQQAADLVVAGSVGEGAGILSIWGVLRFAPHGVCPGAR